MSKEMETLTEKSVAIGHIFGWRKFSLGAYYTLASPGRCSYWSLGVHRAKCKTWEKRAKDHGVAPSFKCSCGFYAYSSLNLLETFDQFGRAEVTARVKAWGRIILHENGFRAQFMEIEELFVDLNNAERFEIRKIYQTPVRRVDVLESFRKEKSAVFVPTLIPVEEVPDEMLKKFGGK